MRHKSILYKRNKKRNNIKKYLSMSQVVVRARVVEHRRRNTSTVLETVLARTRKPRKTASRSIRTSGISRVDLNSIGRRGGMQCLPVSRAKPRLIYPRYERACRIEFDHKQSRWKKTRRVNNDLIRFRNFRGMGSIRGGGGRGGGINWERP